MTVRLLRLAALPLLALAANACASTKSTPPTPVLAAGTSPQKPAIGNPHDAAALVPIDADDPRWGSDTALVTMVEFSDFECPFCKRVEPTLTQLQAAYGPKQLRIVWKNEPLSGHRHALPAAEAAMAVFAIGGSDAFWRFHDALVPVKALPDSYEEFAQKAGVDPAAFRARLATGYPAEKVVHDLAVGEKLGVNGTPAFFINGVNVAGALPFEDFKGIVDLALGQARALLDKGTAPDQLYAAATAVNYTPNNGDAESDREPPDDTTTVWKVAVGASPVRGNKDAPVTIVEFGDFECAYCKKGEPTVASLLSKYGDKVRFVWKNNPLAFHPRAEPSAELALEARAEKGDATFWTAHDKLMAAGDLGDAALEGIAKELGLAAAKVKKALAQHSYKSTIADDVDLASSVEARGTPLFFVNGRKVVGAQPEELFSKIIDEEIAHAATLAKTTAASKIYDAITANGKVAADPPMVSVPALSAFATANEVKVSATSGKPARASAFARANVADPKGVTIVEFGDFECPFCNRVEPTLAEVLADSKVKLQLVWENRPLEMHAHAELAAEAAYEAAAQKGEPAFWKMHNLLFAHQEDANGLEQPALTAYAKEVGLDESKFKAALDGRIHATEIAAESKKASDLGLDGTPTFLVFSSAGDGKLPDGSAAGAYVVSGAVDAAVFRRAIALAATGPKPTAPREK